MAALGDEDLKGCASLAELRLGHNELTALPEALSSCSRLKIVDLGSNRIADIDSVQVRQFWMRVDAPCDTARHQLCYTTAVRVEDPVPD